MRVEERGATAQCNMCYLFAIDFNVGYIVFKDGRHVELRKLVLAKDDEEARFTTGTIAHDDQLLAYGSHDRVLIWIRNARVDVLVATLQDCWFVSTVALAQTHLTA